MLCIAALNPKTVLAFLTGNFMVELGSQTVNEIVNERNSKRF
jgi:hypothetical protein